MGAFESSKSKPRVAFKSSALHLAGRVADPYAWAEFIRDPSVNSYLSGYQLNVVPRARADLVKILIKPESEDIS